MVAVDHAAPAGLTAGANTVKFDGADRRRVTIATVLTLVALPSLWLMSRDDPTGPATVTPAGVGLGPEAATATSRPAAPDAMGTARSAFLDPPEVEPEGVRQPGDPIPVAVPAPPRGSLVTGRATFRSNIPNTSSCLVAGAPANARVRITNVNNGRSISCVASVSAFGSRDDVVLHTDAFTQIAALVDSPVAVEITW